MNREKALSGRSGWKRIDPQGREHDKNIKKASFSGNGL